MPADKGIRLSDPEKSDVLYFRISKVKVKVKSFISIRPLKGTFERQLHNKRLIIVNLVAHSKGWSNLKGIEQ